MYPHHPKSLIDISQDTRLKATSQEATDWVEECSKFSPAISPASRRSKPKDYNAVALACQTTHLWRTQYLCSTPVHSFVLSLFLLVSASYQWKPCHCSHCVSLDFSALYVLFRKYTIVHTLCSFSCLIVFVHALRKSAVAVMFFRNCSYLPKNTLPRG